MTSRNKGKPQRPKIDRRGYRVAGKVRYEARWKESGVERTYYVRERDYL